MWNGECGMLDAVRLLDWRRRRLINHNFFMSHFSPYLRPNFAVFWEFSGVRHPLAFFGLFWSFD